MRISDWSSDVCSSDLVQLPKRRLSRAVDVELLARAIGVRARDEPDDRRGDVGGDGDAAEGHFGVEMVDVGVAGDRAREFFAHVADGERGGDDVRSAEHTSELQSLMRISYAVFCLTKKKQQIIRN